MSAKTIFRAAVAVGAVALGVLGAATPAQAASDTIYTTRDYGLGLLEYHDGVSDDLYVIRDYTGNDYGVRGEVRSAGGSLLSWNFVSGSSASRSWYYDLAKGKDYFLRVCLASSISDTTPINCQGAWVRDE